MPRDNSMERFYNVIPSIRLPRSAPAGFTYSFEQPLAPDTFVSIPFRHSFIKGMVYHEVKRPRFATKPIRATHGIFPSGFTKFIQTISEDTLDHPGSILKLSLLHSKPIIDTLPAPQQYSHGVDWHIYQTFDERIEWLFSKVKRAKQKKQRVLITIPNQSEAKRIGEILVQRLPQFVTLNPKTITISTDSQFSFCLITTRLGCLIPIRFHQIICDDEPNNLYIHSEPAPAYDARTILSLRNTILHEHITYSGYSISCSTQLTEHLSKHTTPEASAHGNRILWVPMDRSDRVPKTPITKALVDAISSSTGKVGIIAPSRIFSNSVTCASCQFKPSCSSCGRAMVAVDDYQLTCPRCKTLDVVPPFCPICSGTSFNYLGFGANRIRSVLSKQPRIQLEQLDTLSFWNTEGELISSPCSTLCITDLDALIPPTYDGQEQIYHRILKLLSQYQSIKCIVQYRSEQLKENLHNLERFFTREKTLRKQLDLPPFGVLICARYASKATKHLSFDQASQVLCECLHASKDQIQGLERTKRKHPYYTFLVRLDHKLYNKVEWKKLPLGFHCLRYR